MSSMAARRLGISLRRLWRLQQGHACMLPAAGQFWLQTQPWQSVQPDCVKASAGLAARSFSAQPGSDADTTHTRNMQLRLMRVVAIGMLIVAAARIIPIVCESCSALNSGRLALFCGSDCASVLFVYWQGPVQSLRSCSCWKQKSLSCRWAAATAVMSTAACQTGMHCSHPAGPHRCSISRHAPKCQHSRSPCLCGVSLAVSLHSSPPSPAASSCAAPSL